MRKIILMILLFSVLSFAQVYEPVQGKPLIDFPTLTNPTQLDYLPIWSVATNDLYKMQLGNLGVGGLTGNKTITGLWNFTQPLGLPSLTGVTAENTIFFDVWTGRLVFVRGGEYHYLAEIGDSLGVVVDTSAGSNSGGGYISALNPQSNIQGVKTFADGELNGIIFGIGNRLAIPSIGLKSETAGKYMGWTGDSKLAFDGKIIMNEDETRAELDKVFKHTPDLYLHDRVTDTLDFADKSSTSRYYMTNVPQTIVVKNWNVGGTAEFMFNNKFNYGRGATYKFLNEDGTEAGASIKWLNGLVPSFEKGRTYFLVLKNVGGTAIFSYAFVSYFNPFVEVGEPEQ